MAKRLKFVTGAARSGEVGSRLPLPLGRGNEGAGKERFRIACRSPSAHSKVGGVEVVIIERYFFKNYRNFLYIFS